MAKPRKRLVSLQDTPYYHCISRCVRRAYLCGIDPNTGFDFSHRRGWIVNRIKQLADAFAIDVYAYAVMSNHYHIVVKVDADASTDWTDHEVADRWLRLFKGPDIVRRWAHGEPMGQGEMAAVAAFIEEWRRRLADLSWFMRCLNETIARMANREDECKGRFWEGRFKSQALLDERALLACMAYVDLNPIRAGLANTPETSEYTSVQERIENPNPSSLSLFQGQSRADGNIPFRLEDYLTLVDWSGRAIRADKPGYIPPHAPPILERLGMERGATLDYVRRNPHCSTNALGPVSRVRAMARSAGLKFIKGMRLNQRLCPDLSSPAT